MIYNKKYIYLRESTNMQDSGRQMVAIERYLSQNNQNISEYQVFSDNGKSGGSLISERMSSEIVKQLSQGDFILVADMARISRNNLDRLAFVTMCDKIGVTIFDIEGNGFVTLDDSSNGIKEIINSWKDSTFLKDLSKKVKDGIEAARSKGTIVGGDARVWGTKSNYTANMTNLEREQYRHDVNCIAARISAERSKQKAKSNPNNLAFVHFIEDYVLIHGQIDFKTTDWDGMVRTLNKRGLKTATGMEFNTPRVKAMYQKYNNNLTSN